MTHASGNTIVNNFWVQNRFCMAVFKSTGNLWLHIESISFMACYKVLSLCL